VFNRSRIKLKMWFKNLFSPRKAQPRFINPYAMSEPTTPKQYVRPEFKDGRFILKKEEEQEKEEQKEKPPKKPDGGIIKAITEVVIEDLEGLSGEAKRKAKKAAEDKEKYESFMELATRGKR